jgi:hypothetical protein
MIKRLSDRKLQLIGKIGIYFPVTIGHDEIKISEIEIKAKYLIVDNKLNFIDFRPIFYNQLSMKWGIKKKNIYVWKEQVAVNFEGKIYSVDKYPTKIFFIDEKWFKSWVRDFKLTNIGI